MEASSSSRASLLELPYDVFVDCLVPFIPTRDLARLRQACKTLQQWVDGEFIWHKRIADDFNFPEHASARVAGWQELYRGLSSPKLFTWGESGSFRLGVDSFAMDRRLHDLVYGHYTGGAPFPLTVDYSRPKRMSEGIIRKDINAHSNPANNFEGNAGIPVKIAAGGWGFHVLTTEGRLLAWGTMDGDVDSRARAWSPTPFVLPLPQTAEGGRDARVKQLSCGRKHGVALTSEGSVLEWHAWHDVRAHHEQLLPPEAISPDSVASLSQLEAGWDFSVALFDVTTPTASSSLDGRHQAMGGNQALRNSASSRIVYWHTEWIGESDPEPAPFRRGVPSTTHWTDVPKVVLPPLPAPSSDVAEEMGMLSSEGQQQQDDDGGLRIIQVGCGEDYVIALTSSGLVYKLDVSPVSQGAADVGDAASFARAASALTRLFEAGTRTWQLMEHFCVPSRIAALSAFAPRPGNERLSSLVKHRNQLKIKHISAQFRTWAAYTSEPPSSTRGEAEATAQESENGGIVLMGKGDAVSSTGPLVKPELQGAGVIKISVGDWHYGALTSSGRVLTWGAWSNGALGIWDSLPLAQQPQQPPPQTQTPLLARFRVGLAGARLGIRQPLAQQQGPSQQQQQQDNAWRVRLASRIIPRQGVDVPTEVRFDGDEEKSRRTFVFDIAFAGWQSAAIAIDSHLVDGGQEEDVDAMEEDEQEEQDTLHQDPPSDGELIQDASSPSSSRDAASSSSSFSSFPHAPPPSTSPRQRQPFGRQIVSSASSIPSLGPIASSSITTPLTHPTSPPSPPPSPPPTEHEHLPHLLLITSLLFLTLGLSLVLFLPSSGLSLSDSSSSTSDSDEAGGGMWVWITRLSFWALLLIPMYLYATIARWVGESMGRG